MKLQSLMSMQTDPEQFWRMFSGDLSERHRSAARAVKLWIAMDCNGPGPSLLSVCVNVYPALSDTRLIYSHTHW